MNNDEALNKVKEIIFSVPGEIYKYEQPKDCFDEDWEEASPQEKAYILIEDLLVNLNKKEINKKRKAKNNLIEIKLEIIPRFYSMADENMFFNAMNSLPSIKDIKGSGRELFLYCNKTMAKEEKDFLVGLFKRYQIPIPLDLQ